MEGNNTTEKSLLEDAGTENKDKKIKNLIAAVILLSGLFAGSVFVDVVQMVRGKGYSEKALQSTDVFSAVGKTWVAYPDPVIKIQTFTDDSCESCNPEETLVLLRRVLPTISAAKIDSNSEEGKKMLADFKIRSLPAFVFSKEIEGTEFFAQTEQLFEKINDQYLLKTAEAGIKTGKYIELPKIGEGDIKIGPDGAKVKIIEFSDFQCPYCKNLHNDMSKILTEYGDKIQFVFKNFPLEFHTQAENAALASECANEQGKFLDYAGKLFAEQDKWGKTDGTQKFKDLARQAGIGNSQFNSCLDDKKFQDKINRDKEEAASFGISGTPAIFVNDQFNGGSVAFDALKTMIDKELAK